jgi:hypothetical protein
MNTNDFTVAFTVDNTQEEAFDAITRVRDWWSAELVGETAKLGDRFTFEVPGVHKTTQTLTEVIPNEKIVWSVSDSWIGFVDDKAEWEGTQIVFDISRVGEKTQVRFTHVGLVPSIECYQDCSSAWSSYMIGSLHDLITTGTGDPYRANGTAETEKAKYEAVNSAATA